MVKRFKQQSGSAHVIIIIVLILAVLGLLGFVVWQNFIAKPADEQQTAISEQTATSSDTDASSSEGYVVIEEWGVKFPISSSLKSTEVRYAKTESSDTTQQVSYAFTTARIQALGGECSGQPYGNTVILIRHDEKPAAVPDGELVNEDAIDGYYYAMGQPPAGCSSFDESGEMQSQSEVEINDRNALKESIRELIAI